MYKRNKKGFTLIELLIVIAILGVLAVAFLPSLLGAPSKGRDTNRLANVQKIQNFLISRSIAQESMPDTGCLIEGDTTEDSIGKLIGEKLADFGGVFPLDPVPDNEATKIGGGLGTCKGQFGYINYKKDALAGGYTVDYAAGVYSKVENQANANISCSKIDGKGTHPIGEDMSAVTDETEYCYLVRIQ